VISNQWRVEAISKPEKRPETAMSDRQEGVLKHSLIVNRPPTASTQEKRLKEQDK
jgi:hypothetical protein